MTFSIRGILLSMVWVASSCVLASLATSNIGFVGAFTRASVLCVSIAYLLPTENGPLRVFFVAFAVSQFLLISYASTLGFRLSMKGGYAGPEHMRQAMLIAYLATDAASMTAGVAAKWSYTRHQMQPPPSDGDPAGSTDSRKC